MYLKKNMIRNDMCTPVFIAALFPIPKTWKQPKCLSTEEWIKTGHIYACVCAQSLQSCLTLCNPVDCSPPGSSVYGILQARILEWVATSSSRGSSWPRDWTSSSCIADEFFTAEPPGKHMSRVFRWKSCHGQHLDCSLVKDLEPEAQPKLYLGSWPTETVR